MKKNQQRLGELGSFHHVFSHGLDSKPLLLDERDRRTFLLILAEVLRLTGARCYAFALMLTHYHLLLQATERSLSHVMHRINVRYALYFNRRHEGRGHVFQGRFQSVLVESDEHLTTELAYVLLNPVRAGVIQDERALRDYPWASHAALMGRIPMTFVEADRVLEWFSQDRRHARAELSAFVHGVRQRDFGDVDDAPSAIYRVENAIRFRPREADDLGARNVVGILGDSQRIDRVLRECDWRTWCRGRLTRDGWTAERLLARVCELLRVSPWSVASGSRTHAHSRARALYCHLAHAYLRVPLKVAARATGVSAGAASRRAVVGADLAELEAFAPATVFRAPWMASRDDRSPPSSQGHPAA